VYNYRIWGGLNINDALSQGAIASQRCRGGFRN